VGVSGLSAKVRKRSSGKGPYMRFVPRIRVGPDSPRRGMGVLSRAGAGSPREPGSRIEAAGNEDI